MFFFYFFSCDQVLQKDGELKEKEETLRTSNEVCSSLTRTGTKTGGREEGREGGREGRKKGGREERGMEDGGRQEWRKEA